MDEKEVKKDMWYWWKVLTNKTVKPEQLTQDDMSGYNIFQMNKLVSSINIYLPDIAEISMFDMSKVTHYTYLFNLLPNNFIKANYPKSNKKNNEDEKIVASYFEFGTRDMKTAMKFLKEKDILTIKKKYGRQK